MRKQNLSVLIITAIFVLLLINIPLGLYLYSRGDENTNALTDTEIYLLNPLPQNAPTAKKEAYDKAIQKNTQQGTTLYISENCKMFPIVLQVQPFTELLIKNSDTKTHTIRFTQKLNYRIPPGKQVSIFVRFPGGLGSYGYSCDNPKTTSLSGYIFVNP